MHVNIIKWYGECTTVPSVPTLGAVVVFVTAAAAAVVAYSCLNTNFQLDELWSLLCKLQQKLLHSNQPKGDALANGIYEAAQHKDRVHRDIGKHTFEKFKLIGFCCFVLVHCFNFLFCLFCLLFSLLLLFFRSPRAIRRTARRREYVHIFRSMEFFVARLQRAFLCGCFFAQTKMIHSTHKCNCRSIAHIFRICLLLSSASFSISECKYLEFECILFSLQIEIEKKRVQLKTSQNGKM